MIIQSEQPVDNMNFQFHSQPNITLQEKKFREYLEKWGVAHSLQLFTFVFDLKFDHLNSNQFLVDLFNSPEVRQAMPSLSGKKDEFISLVQYDTLNCKETRLDMFDKLEEDRIVVRGNIKGQFEEIFEEIQIADELRAALVLEDSEKYCVFNETDRQELMFKLFQILVLGGQMCQYEDQLQPYLDQTKYLYKNVVNARKHADKDDIYLDTFAYQIKKIANIYKSDHPQNVLFVIVNPSLRVVHIISNRWIKVW